MKDMFFDDASRLPKGHHFNMLCVYSMETVKTRYERLSEYELFSTKTDRVTFLADSLLSACFFITIFIL